MAPRSGNTICFVDDDPAERDRFLRAFGDDFNVITACTYSEAISKLKELASILQKLSQPRATDTYAPRLFTSPNAET